MSRILCYVGKLNLIFIRSSIRLIRIFLAALILQEVSHKGGILSIFLLSQSVGHIERIVSLILAGFRPVRECVSVLSLRNRIVTIHGVGAGGLHFRVVACLIHEGLDLCGLAGYGTLLRIFTGVSEFQLVFVGDVVGILRILTTANIIKGIINMYFVLRLVNAYQFIISIYPDQCIIVSFVFLILGYDYAGKFKNRFLEGCRSRCLHLSDFLSVCVLVVLHYQIVIHSLFKGNHIVTILSDLALCIRLHSRLSIQRPQLGRLVIASVGCCICDLLVTQISPCHLTGCCPVSCSITVFIDRYILGIRYVYRSVDSLVCYLYLVHIRHSIRNVGVLRILGIFSSYVIQSVVDMNLVLRLIGAYQFVISVYSG